MLYLRTAAVRSGGALTVVAVAALAAACSHVVIDALGDVLLRHDTYDDVAHDSRAVLIGAAAALLLAAGARSVYDALRSALGHHAACQAFRIASPLRFIGQVLALAIPFVLSMEAADAAVAGRAVDDLGDLFGGSVALGFGTTVGVALIIALGAVAALRFFCRTRRLLVRALLGFFAHPKRKLEPAITGTGARRPSIAARLLLARHAAKRGPPLPLPTVSNDVLSFRQSVRSFSCFSIRCAHAVRWVWFLR